MPQSWVGSMQGSNEGCLPLMVIFHRRLSSTKGHLPLKVVFQWRLSSTKGFLPPKVIFHRRPSSTEGHLPPKVVFHQRLSSTGGRLSPTITPWLILYLWEQSTYPIPTLLRSGLKILWTNKRTNKTKCKKPYVGAAPHQKNVKFSYT